MAAPLAAKAYQQEAARLDPAELHVANKTIRHEAGLTLGPLSVRLTVTDYEFAPPAPPAPTPFGDVFDTAAAATELGDALPPQAAPASVLPPALVQPAIQQETASVHLHFVHRPGYGSGRTPKGDFHDLQSSPFARSTIEVQTALAFATEKCEILYVASRSLCSSLRLCPGRLRPAADPCRID